MNETTIQLYSSLLAVVSGIVFWAGFLIFGFIARRYSSVFNRPTFYGLLMTAPSGILVYSVLLILKSSLFIKSPELGGMIQVAAYVCLVVSGALCLAAIMKFNRLLDELLKYKG
jgi:hypothetical protein